LSCVAPLAHARTQQALVPNPSSAPLFHAVAIDAGVVVAAAQDFDRPDLIFSSEGGAFVFDAATGAYLRSLYPNEPWQGPRYGSAVDVSAGRAIVGAYRDRSAAGVYDYGAAYIFDVHSGSQLFRLNSTHQQLGGWFGNAVAISPEYALVGAPSEGPALTGSVYLYNAQTGQELDRFQLPSPPDRAWFGWSTAIDGSKAVVGAAGGFTTSAGGAYLYDLDTRTQIAPLNAPDLVAGSHFGIDVAISGDRVVVGATEGLGGTGSAYVFDATDGSFLRKLTPPDLLPGDEYGVSVAIEGDIALISSRTDSPIANAGAVYVFNVETGALLDKFQAMVPALNSDFGWQVDFTGTTAVLGTSQSSAFLVNGFNIPEPSTSALIAAIGVICSRQRRPGPRPVAPLPPFDLP
jgi:outer membrane protein assembly factor BamB